MSCLFSWKLSWSREWDLTCDVCLLELREGEVSMYTLPIFTDMSLEAAAPAAAEGVAGLEQLVMEAE